MKFNDNPVTLVERMPPPIVASRLKTDPSGTLERLHEKLATHRVDAFLVSKPPNVRYVTGFSAPKDGRVLLCRRHGILFTDARYSIQAREESTLPVSIWKGRDRWTCVANHLRKLGISRLAVETDALTVPEWRHLRNLLPCRLRPVSAWVDELRQVKRSDEIAHMSRAAALNDRAFQHILPSLRPGVTERDLALELEWFLRTNGDFQIAFEVIVASGPNGARPHASPTLRKFQYRDLITLDFGSRCEGYASDITRTVAIGKPPRRLRSIYQTVLRSQTHGLETLRPGIQARDVDRAVRHLIRKAGLGPYFTHSLGHGVGLEIHEPPRLSTSSREVLQAGMIVTCEPGIYVPEIGGVRIEDLVLITKTGHERLSQSPKELLCL
ncbi:MAG: aminopeptidase P family protein [Planctomycetes bacterium]|nr:aminopeptidase P family protein [Planctomycetota bacterium]